MSLIGPPSCCATRPCAAFGPAGLEQLTAGPFEIEDILYVIAPVTWLGWLQPCLLATAVGASLFACYCAARLARVAGLLPRYASSRPR